MTPFKFDRPSQSIEVTPTGEEGNRAWHAQFMFSLAWIVKPKDRVRPTEEQLETQLECRGSGFETLLETLTPSQSVTFRLSNRNACGESRCAAWLIGDSYGATEEEATQQAHILRAKWFFQTY